MPQPSSPAPHRRADRRWLDLLKVTALWVAASNALCWLTIVKLGGLAMGPMVVLPATLVPALIAPWVAWRIRRLTIAVDQAHAELHRIAGTDTLTQVLNRGRFLEAFGRDFARAVRSGEPITLLMLDLDDFRQLNDTHGHPVGDAVLQAVGRALREALRPGDPIGRWGSEEFVVGLDLCPLDAAREVAERLRAAIDGLVLATPSSRVLRTSASVGLATWSGRGESLEVLVRRADLAMHAAKKAGRNRVTVAAPPVGRQTLPG